ncbi:hypothetical protein FA13DRAFT_1781751 [Coprinellus micaceus]|uniref:Uncharacterized protein n=1 Tax=Coprinellus micaceus TaxID=71717 RepID=A0A4Y7S9F1_COPMI|nr:hypothetical protein FA13DRAFT_1781751 [Coprinellus micaceus]
MTVFPLSSRTAISGAGTFSLRRTTVEPGETKISKAFQISTAATWPPWQLNLWSFRTLLYSPPSQFGRTIVTGVMAQAPSVPLCCGVSCTSQKPLNPPISRFSGSLVLSIRSISQRPKGKEVPTRSRQSALWIAGGIVVHGVGHRYSSWRTAKSYYEQSSRFSQRKILCM